MHVNISRLAYYEFWHLWGKKVKHRAGIRVSVERNKSDLNTRGTGKSKGDSSLRERSKATQSLFVLFYRIELCCHLDWILPQTSLRA